MANVAYFKGCETLAEIRERLISHIKTMEPGTAKFDTMSEQYRKACAKYGNVHKSRRGKTYNEIVKMPPITFAAMMKVILDMEGLEVYCEGDWVWVKGETKAHKEELGALGRQIAGKGKLTFSNKRQQWYYKDWAVA